MNKQNIIFSMILLIVSYDNLQASVSIDSDTVKKMYNDGVIFLSIESMDRFVTSSIIQDPTVRQRGLAKIVTGAVICLVANQGNQKNKVTNVAINTGVSLCMSGLSDITSQPPATSFTEKTTQFTVNSVAVPLAINALEHNGYAKSASGAFVCGTTALASTIVLSQCESSKATSVARISSNIRQHSLLPIAVKGSKYLNVYLSELTKSP